MAQQAYDYLAQSARPHMPRRRRSSASAGDPVQLQQLSSLSLLTSPQSQSGSSDASVPPSLVFSSSSPSPASSLTSSPSLGPKHFSHSAAGPEPLSLGIPLQPSGIDLAKYASDIIRNEAYALLALAARLAPAAYPLLDDEGAHVVRADSSSSSVATDSSDDGSDESDDLYAKSPVDLAIEVDESRTNQAFRNVVALVQAMPRHGKILVSGIGKSGIVARKMVATFCSLGIQAAFLHPVEALHGDLGLICSCSPASPCDTVFLISHSGATAELMRLLPIIRPRVRSLVAITRDPESVLASSCHGWLDAGTGVNPAGLPKATTDEADSALPAPTSSVVSALAIGDALALTLSRLRTGWDADAKRRREEFYHCHPGGQLGIQLGREGRVEGSAAGKLQPSVPVPVHARLDKPLKGATVRLKDRRSSRERQGLAAEVDALRAELAEERARTLELSTGVCRIEGGAGAALVRALQKELAEKEEQLRESTGLLETARQGRDELVAGTAPTVVPASTGTIPTAVEAATGANIATAALELADRMHNLAKRHVDLVRQLRDENGSLRRTLALENLHRVVE
ncbi:hypothetical protein JCM3774_000089 [Rhodotorula dairenensis]